MSMAPLRFALALPLAAAIIRILTPEELAQPDEPWETVDYKEADGFLVRATVGHNLIEGNRSATWSRYYGTDIIEADSVTVYIPGLAEITGEFIEETGKLSVTKVARVRRPPWQQPDVFDQRGLLEGLRKMWTGKEVDVTMTRTAWTLKGVGITLEVQRNTSSSGAVDYEHLLLDHPLMCPITVHIKRTAAEKLRVDIATPHIKWHTADADDGASRGTSAYKVGPVPCATEVLVTNRDTQESVTYAAGAVGDVDFPGWSVSCTRELPKDALKTIYVMVNSHNDNLDAELSSCNSRNYGKAVLAALLEATGVDPGNFHIIKVHKFLSADLSVRQYQYDFFDSTGKVTQDMIINCLQERGMLDKINGVVPFTLLRVANQAGTRLSIYVLVNAKNDFLGDEESPRWQTEDSNKNRRFGKAILTTLLAEKSTDPDNYYISHVQKRFTSDWTLREYGYHFFDLTGTVTEAIIVKCLRKPGMIEQINKAVHQANVAVQFRIRQVTEREALHMKTLEEMKKR